jgi:glutamate racemase
VRWIDPASAIARRVVELVGPATGAPAPARAHALFTSGRKPSADLAVALANFGLEAGEFARAADI